MTDRESLDAGLHGADQQLVRAAERARGRIAAQLFDAPRRLAGRYRIVRPLGSGGQGTVWLAVDEQLDREVAIKTLKLELTPRDRADGWLRNEARMLAAVAHPHVVAVFDLGLCEASELDERATAGQTLLFLIMEVVHGSSLAQWLAERSRTTDEVLAIMRQVADGLAAIHRAKLVHCDIKPANVLVSAGVAKIADLGLAHTKRSLASAGVWKVVHLDQTDAGSPAATTSNTSGRIGGTPLYMAPEQLDGAHVDARADEYAFAATLFEALFGRPPHPAETVAQLAIAKHEGAPQCPDASRLDAIAYRELARGLAVDPAARHGSALALLDALARARKRGRVRRWSAWWLLAIAGAIAWLGLRDPSPCDRWPPAIARTELREWAVAHSEEPELASRVEVELQHRVDALASAHARACTVTPPAPLTLLCIHRAEIATKATWSALRTGELSPQILPVLDELTDPMTCVRGGLDVTATDPRLFELWGELARARVLGATGRGKDGLAVLADHGDGPLAVEVALTRGDLLRGLGRFDEALASYEHAWDHAVGLDAARAANGLAFVLGVELRRFDEALDWLRHGEAKLARDGVRPGFRARLLNTRGSIRGARGDFTAAREDFAAALALAEAEREPSTITEGARENLGIALAVLRDPAAIATIEQTLHWREENLGPRHPEVARSLMHLGYALRRLGRGGEARVLLERALAIRIAAHGPTHLEVASVLHSLADLDREEQRFDDAQQRADRIAEIRETLLGPDHPDTLGIIIFRLDVLIDAGELDAAELLVARSVDRIAAAFVPGDPTGIAFERDRGVIALRRGRFDEAAERLTASARASVKRGTPLPDWFLDAAEAQLGRGRPQRASELLVEAERSGASLSPDVVRRIAELRARIP
ncbi:MAG TPA: serine/threonine-protein kinase [Nannocystaceae bacterium]|nr:serine/threonine-protein kinase [Nannocystaceae bacterium]